MFLQSYFRMPSVIYCSPSFIKFLNLRKKVSSAVSKYLIVSNGKANYTNTGDNMLSKMTEKDTFLVEAL